MCDIYGHPCKICGNIIPMHLGDYLTKRNEIEVFCPWHIPDENVTIWEGRDDFYSETRDRYFICGNPIRYGIRYLTENAIENKCMNHPNEMKCKIIEERK